MLENFDNLRIEYPSSLEAEQCVIASILINPNKVIANVLDKLSSKHFYDETCQKLFSIISDFSMKGTPIDAVNLLTQALNDKIFENERLGNAYIGNIIQKVPSVANISSYCDIVLEKYRLRQLLNISLALKEDIYSGKGTAQEITDKLSQKIFDINQGNETRGLVPIRDIMLSTYDKLSKLSGKDKDKYKGLSTGFSALDSVIGGLNKSDLIIVAARPGMGKTSFAMNIATHVAQKNDKEVAIFSLEMSAEQLALRILSSEARIDSFLLRNGILNGDDWIKISYTAENIHNSHMLIDESAGITVQTMKARLQNVKNLGLVVIDYLQLMSSTLRSDNRVVVISEITRNIKIMAKDLNVPIILLSQLSRGPENRTDKRPLLSDLRESGSIEQDADIVLFLYRDSYYNKASEEKNISECIIAKNRHGELNTVKLGWNGSCTKFTNLDTKSVEI